MSFRHLAVATVFAFSACCTTGAMAQVKASSGPSSTVVYVSGNDLVVKASDGKLLNYSVANGTMFSADGKEVPLSALTPGTKLTKAVSTGFDPDIIGAVQVVKGKVFAVTPPDTVTLSLADGIKELKVPENTKFSVDGKEVAISDLKPDMMVEATVVTTIAPDAKPEVANAPAPSTPALSGALLVFKTPGSGDSALPEAGTNLPLYGLLGMILLAMGAALTFWRRPVRS
ncbi:LPXTG cell wall anchor domain-containing protein [Granulicella sp. 5B5]|uniref:LPXTG cell wall anchor domain-containing protein n=1 Tax=Granulicella sp. 5B5 TaxID=1617967 RepID=UPI001757F0FD|nr:LPXTG cell wall anchor domain-containing protein [Granulicella sp. 5B5]QMV17375.1 LPXTG cell wall anchor domain-containing protein [Granulicella sp. 5B5]